MASWSPRSHLEASFGYAKESWKKIINGLELDIVVREYL